MASRPPMPYLLIDAEHDGERSVLRLRGELDFCSADVLRQAVRAVLARRRGRLLVLDLSALRFADCAGLSVMLWARRMLAGRGGTLTITGVQPPVRRLLALTGTALAADEREPALAAEERKPALAAEEREPALADPPAPVSPPAPGAPLPRA